MKLKELDVVRTKFGTIAVVNRVEGRRVSLVLPSTSKQKFAWYEPEELEFVAALKDLVVDRVFDRSYTTHMMKQTEHKMKVYTLMGGYDYEGEQLLGVFASKEDLLNFVEQEKPKQQRRPETLGYDTLGYVESALGQPIDFYGEVEYL